MSVLLKKRVVSDLGGICKVKASGWSISETFVRITFVLVIDSKCLMRIFVFLLQFISIFLSPRGYDHILTFY